MAENGATKRSTTCCEDSASKKPDEGVVHIPDWLEVNKDRFLPPICNKVLNDGWLKIMFIGGPNQRKDYHIECGEELFYMHKGSMVLKIMECGTDPKDIVINEGEVFCLPARTPHSPQRNAGTIGLVIERHRVAEEDDCLRYYMEDGSGDILYQEIFHLCNLMTDLPPIINRYFASEAHKTGKPQETYTDVIPLRKERVMKPFALRPFIEERREELEEKGSISIFEGVDNKVFAHSGVTKSMSGWETWLWQWEGESKLCLPQRPSQTLKAGDSYLVPAETQFTIHADKKSLLLSFQQVVGGYEKQPPM